MWWIIIIALFLIICFTVANSTTKDIEDKEKIKFSNQGYHYIGFSGMIYKGGINNISVNNPVSISLLEEGINFHSGVIDKTISFDSIEDMSLQSQQYIQNQVSLGKLVCFGILAFGMSGKQNSINDEYIVLNVDDENEQYSVLLQAYEPKDNQKRFNIIETHRNNNRKY